MAFYRRLSLFLYWKNETCFFGCGFQCNFSMKITLKITLASKKREDRIMLSNKLVGVGLDLVEVKAYRLCMWQANNSQFRVLYTVEREKERERESSEVRSVWRGRAKGNKLYPHRLFVVQIKQKPKTDTTATKSACDAKAAFFWSNANAIVELDFDYEFSLWWMWSAPDIERNEKQIVVVVVVFCQ